MPTGAAQGDSCSEAIDEAGDAPNSAQGLGSRHKKRPPPKSKTAIPGKFAFYSKRALNRDLPDQLEAHAHRLLKDAGWSITPRIRRDRHRVAYYFAAPQREVVVASLSQAWKFCGQRLHQASGGGKFPMEWSDVDQFWKDLVNTMDSVGKMTADGEDLLALLRRWQLLDPFVAVVFIDKRITSLQQHKTLRAVDSSTHVIDNGNNGPSADSCNGHQDAHNCHHLSNGQGSHVQPELYCTHNMDPEVAGQTENHVQSDDEPGQIYSGANHGNNVVKRARKMSRWLSDFESTGLNGLYARSFARPTIVSNESGSCSIGSSTSKKHMKAKNESTKLSGEKRDLSPHLAHERMNDTLGEGRTEGLVETKGCTKIKSAVTESGANKVVTAEKQQSRTLKKSSVRGSPEDMVSVSNVSNVVAELCHRRNAAVVECNASLEAQSNERTTTKRKSESWENHAKKRSSEMDFNDDDLLITAIVKNRDVNSCHKSALMSVSSKAMFRKLKNSKNDSRLLIQTAQKGGTDVLDGRQIILARKTVLCWLIATGFMTLKDVVQCRNPKNNEVLKDGWIT